MPENDFIWNLRRRSVFGPPPGVDVEPFDVPEEQFPSMAEYRKYLSQAPQIQEPGKLRRVLSAIVGGVAGAGAGPEIGFQVGRRAAYGPSLQAMAKYKTGLEPRREAAEMELSLAKERREEEFRRAQEAHYKALEAAAGRPRPPAPHVFAPALGRPGMVVTPRGEEDPTVKKFGEPIPERTPAPHVFPPAPGRPGMVVRPEREGAPGVEEFGEPLPLPSRVPPITFEQRKELAEFQARMRSKYRPPEKKKTVSPASRETARKTATKEIYEHFPEARKFIDPTAWVFVLPEGISKTSIKDHIMRFFGVKEPDAASLEQEYRRFLESRDSIAGHMTGESRYELEEEEENDAEDDNSPG